MKTNSPDTVAVLGAGTMGQGIAQVCVQAGHKVILYDPYDAALDKARAALKDILEMLERKGRLESAINTMRRLSFTSNLASVQACNWLIEAVPEDVDIKLELFTKLPTLSPETVLATNTSTLSISSLAAASKKPAQLLGMHFFNPAPLLKLVEVIPGRETPPALLNKALAFVKGLGKHPVVAKDSPGFIVNRVARPYYSEALELHGNGVSTESIDRIMRSLGFRMGPFELMDLIGIDINYAATKSVYEAFFHEPRYRPHPLQRALVEAGQLGKKTGRGFYNYPRAETEAPRPEASPADVPNALVVGEGRLADNFRERFKHTTNPQEAALVVDLTLGQASPALPKEAAHLPVLSLQWGHSASLALRRYPRAEAATGISFVPPLTDRSVLELYPPLSGENAASTLATRYFEAQGFPVISLPDQPGGIGFRILAMLINEAVSALAENLATPEDIDSAMKLGTNYPLGPLEWSERIGLENVLAGLTGIFDELSEDRYRPQPLLKRMVAAGLTNWSEL